MTTIEQVIDRLEQASRESHAATMAALHLCRTMVSEGKARFADDDNWLRMPAAPRRCPVSGWSRKTIENHAKAGHVRTKLVKGGRFYAGADVARLIQSA